MEYFEDPKGNTVSKVVRPAHAEGEKDIRAETGRNLAAGKDEKADPCHDGLSPRCTPPTSKPVEHRSLAGSPTKSPSSGLHKPTWKPSSKPNEHRKLGGKTDKPSEKSKTNKPAEKATNQGAALPRQLQSAAKVIKDDAADPCHDGLSPRCTPPTSKPVEHRTLQTAAGKKLQPPEGIEAKHPAVPIDATAGVPTKSPSAGLHKPTWYDPFSLSLILIVKHLSNTFFLFIHLQETIFQTCRTRRRDHQSHHLFYPNSRWTQDRPSFPHGR